MIVQVLKKYWVSNDIGFPEQGLNELSENKSNNIINQKKKTLTNFVRPSWKAKSLKVSFIIFNKNLQPIILPYSFCVS